MLKQVKLSILFLLLFLLTACVSNPFAKYTPPNKTVRGAIVGAAGGAAIGGVAGGSAGAGVGAVVGGITGGLIGKHLQRKETPEERIEDQLVHQGIQVIKQGDDYLLVIPNDEVFYHGTPRIKWKSYSILNTTVEFLRLFEKVNVSVNGYTDDIGPPLRNRALSQARAQNVADYLWSQNIDARIMTARGFGDKDPIASNLRKAGRRANQRIEIRFRRIVSEVA